MKMKLKKFAKVTFLLSLADFALSYVCFHFLTDAGFTTVWQPEAGKPYVTLMIMILGVLFLFSSIVSLLMAKIFFEE